MSFVGDIFAAKSAAKGQTQAANAARDAASVSTAEQQRQYDLSRADNAPWLQTGQSALGQLAGLYGLGPQTAAGFDNAGYLAQNKDVADAIQSGTYSGSALDHYNQYGKTEGRQGGVTAGSNSNMAGFFASPDYQFRQDEQNRSLTARNSALGIQDSGAAQKAALKYSGNLASGEFNNYANRLSSLAGVGQTAAASNQALGTNYANAVTNIQGNQASALGSSYINKGNIYGNLISNLNGQAQQAASMFLGAR